MTIEAVAALGVNTIAPTDFVQLQGVASSPNEAGTFDALVRGIENLNQQMTATQQSAETLAAGNAENLHRVMMDMERAKLQFEFALQVRNKVLEAYQELIRMQV